MVSTVLVLLASPFTAPLVERSAASAARAIDRAMAATVTPDWLIPRLGAAIAADDADAVAFYTGLAQDHAVPLPPATAEAAMAVKDRHEGALATARDCARCALDVAECREIALIAACGIPLELTPVGDLNALRRAGIDALAGEDVDRLEVGLALVGLGATAAAVASGGSSVTVKAGATLLRMARRMGTLTPGLARVIRETADVPVNWARLPDWIAGTVPASAVTDTVRLARLGDMAADAGRVRRNTSTAETLVMLRHVEDADDLSRLARVSDVTLGDTRRTVEALGLGRAFRLTMRLADTAIAALAGLYALFLQACIGCGTWCARRLLRLLREL